MQNKNAKIAKDIRKNSKLIFKAIRAIKTKANKAAASSKQGNTQSNWSCSEAASERDPMNIVVLCDWGEKRSQQSCSFK
jgi:methylaspartate ammonia-lyase